MNDLDELLYKLKLCGFDYIQANAIITIVFKWIDDQYPVMGALAQVWLKENGFEMTEEEKRK